MTETSPTTAASIIAADLPDDATDRELSRLNLILADRMKKLDRRTDLIVHALAHLEARETRIAALEVKLSALEDGFMTKHDRPVFGASL